MLTISKLHPNRIGPDVERCCELASFSTHPLRRHTFEGEPRHDRYRWASSARVGAMRRWGESAPVDDMADRLRRDVQMLVSFDRRTTHSASREQDGLESVVVAVLAQRCGCIVERSDRSRDQLWA